MESKGWWDDKADEDLKAKLKEDVMTAFKQADKLQRCELGELFTDVYAGEEPWNIVRQLTTTLRTSPSPSLDRATGGTRWSTQKIQW